MVAAHCYSDEDKRDMREREREGAIGKSGERKRLMREIVVELGGSIAIHGGGALRSTTGATGHRRRW
ncbi:hypothetical protein Hanom_Chr00s000562g01649481 [Helianthus anomalus]